VDNSLLGKKVFVFHPHSSHIVVDFDACLLVPDDVAPEAALFLANMETAVNLVQDVKPILGECGVVLGQGIVGLLVSALLSEFPLSQLYAIERYSKRRAMAETFSTVTAIDPEKALHGLNDSLFSSSDGADFVVEVTGSPEALNLAIELTGYGARIVIGSWYGNKAAPLALGGKAHRNRLTVYTSQVSTIAPELGARWNNARRFSTVWDAIRRLQPEKFISHRVPIEQASTLYERLDSKPEDVTQAILVYSVL